MFLATIKKYFSLFVRSFFFLMMILLIAHFGDFLSLTNKNPLQNLRSVFWIILNLSVALIPAASVISSAFFFSFPHSLTRSFFTKAILILIFINSVFLGLYLFYPDSLNSPHSDIRKKFEPNLREQTIYHFPGASLFMAKKKQTGLLIFGKSKKVFFIEKTKKLPATLELFSFQSYLDNFYREKAQIQIPIRNQTQPIFFPSFVRQFSELFSEDLAHTHKTFKKVFSLSNPIFSLLSLFFFSIGFFSVIFTMSLFFKDRTVYILNVSFLFLLILAEYLAFTPLVQLIALFQGIQNPGLALLVPSVLTAFLGILFTFVMMQFKIPKLPSKAGQGDFHAPTF